MNATADSITAPEHITSRHDISAFDCGVTALNDWLRKRALPNEESGASRTYVVSPHGQVVGYYALASGAVALSNTPGRIRRNMPDPVPVMILARLAVDRLWQNRSIGRSLLRDAILRILQAAEIAGIRAMLMHAISEDVKRFYERYGFIVSPVEPMTLMISVAGAEKAFSGS